MKLRHFITIAATLIIIALWFIFAAWPQYKDRRLLKSKIAESERRLSDYRKIMVEFHEQFDSHQQLLKRKTELISRLYSKKDIILLFGELTAKSSKYDLDIMEFSPSVKELIELNQTFVEADQPLHLNITLTMRGPVKSAGRFIGDVESQNYYKGFNYCSIRNTRDNNPYSEISYSFKAILGTLKEG